MSGIHVLRPGPLTTIQDLGRPGFAHLGVPPSGAMDDRAYRAVQRALGNPMSAGALEVTLNTLELEFLEPLRAAVCDGRALTIRDWRAGERLTLRPTRAGARTCIAFAGELDVPLVLGSRSTYLPARFGGFKGRKLRAGDLLTIKRSSPPFGGAPASLGGDPREIRTIGFQGEWKTDPRSDRQGVRFTGGNARGGEQLSRAAFPGLIQLPPDGTAIVLGPDAQTVGGYKIGGCVIVADLWKLGQLLPGDEVTFTKVSRDAAERAVVDSTA